LRAFLVLITAFLPLTAVLTGCASRAREAPTLADPPEAFTVSGTAAVPDRWWTVFDDEQLNVLVDEALRSNFSLKTAWSRLRAARAVVGRESSALFPDLDGTASAQTSEGTTSDGEEYSVGLLADYEVDLWGRIRSLVDVEKYQARSTMADYQAAAISLSA